MKSKSIPTRGKLVICRHFSNKMPKGTVCEIDFIKVDWLHKSGLKVRVISINKTPFWVDSDWFDNFSLTVDSPELRAIDALDELIPVSKISEPLMSIEFTWLDKFMKKIRGGKK